MTKVYFMKASENNTPDRISADAETLFNTFPYRWLPCLKLLWRRKDRF